MASRTETSDDAPAIDPTIGAVLSKALYVNTFAALVAAAVTAAIDPGAITGLLAGIAIGAVGIGLCFSVGTRGSALMAEKVKGFVASRFYLRFAFTATTMLTLIYFAGLSPWGLLAGYSTVLMGTVVAILMTLKLSAASSTASSMETSSCNEVTDLKEEST